MSSPERPGPGLLAPVSLHPSLPPSSRLGIGTARLGAFWQHRGLRDGAATMRLALEAGISLVDTADCYARGISEVLVGRAIRGHHAVVITKAGLVKTPPAMLRSRSGGLRGLLPGPDSGTCFTPSYLAASHAASVRRLGQQPDVLLLHEPPADVVAGDEAGGALVRLRDRGNVRAVGVSVRDEAATRAALAAEWVDVVEAPVPVLASLGNVVAASGKAVVALAVLADGAALSDNPGREPGSVAVALAGDAAALPGVGGVLLGMSRPASARANIAALQKVPA